MKTIQETVETIIHRTPFIEEAMQDKLINVSSLARLIQPEVERSLGKEVKSGAIMMSINRMSPLEILKLLLFGGTTRRTWWRLLQQSRPQAKQQRR